jgi:hypothetical protein
MKHGHDTHDDASMPIIIKNIYIISVIISVTSMLYSISYVFGFVANRIDSDRIKFDKIEFS